jgi:hypothetical protein
MTTARLRMQDGGCGGQGLLPPHPVSCILSPLQRRHISIIEIPLVVAHVLNFAL